MRERIRSMIVIQRMMAAADRRLLIVVYLLTPLHTVFWAAFMLIARALTDTVVSGDTDGAVPLVIALGAIMAAWPVWWFFIARAAATLHERTNREFERRLVDDAVTAPGLQQHESPEYLDGLRTLLTQMRDLGNPFALASSVGGMSLLVVSVVLLASIDPLCMLLPLFAVPCVLITAHVERRRVASEHDMATEQRLRQRLFAVQTEPASVKEVKVLGLERELRGRHRGAWSRAIKTADRVEVRGALLISCGWAIFTLGLTAALWLIVWRGSHGEVSTGDVMLFAMVSQAVSLHVADLLNVFTDLQRSITAATRYRWLDGFTRRMRETERAARTVEVPDKIEQGIALEHVTFSYPGQDVPTLSGVSLELPAGATVAIVGENGAGKTTLVKLLCRFYEPTHGRVTLDGHDLAGFELPAWRARLSAGFQDFVRFELLVREAVGVGNLTAIDDLPAVRRSLNDAGEDDVEQRLAHGLETQLGSRWSGGVDLSGGQWQRLALARAFMRQDPLLLILDEPTANLDAATEDRLFTRFADAARTRAADGAITLFISHRFSTVRAADLIVVVEDGGIAEHGTHEQLMRTGGPYSELYELQAHAYRESAN